MLGDLTIRGYQEADWAAVCRVHDRARRLEFADGRRVRTLAEAAGEDGFFRSRTFVAIAGGQVVGFASIEGALLTFLYVDPALHRRGIGRALMEHVTPLLGAEGYTYTSADNRAAIGLYRSAGMEVACRFPGEAEGVGGECVRLAFPTSSQRRRAGRPTALALELEARRRGVGVDQLPTEWAAEA